MRSRLVLTIALVAVSANAWAQGGRIDPLKLARFDRAAYRASPMAMFPVDNRAGIQIAYGDRYGLVRVARVTDDGVSEIYRSRPLQGEIAEILITDFVGNGGSDIVARTQQGNVLVIESDPFGGTFTERWDSINEGLRNVTAMCVANVDDDPEYELVLFADSQILYYDGASFSRQYQSTQTYRAGVREIYVGDVDTDPDPEIVLNNGLVIDAISGEPEWDTEPFGQQIELVDIDGDGLQEILGYQGTGTSMRIFDADSREEKPLQ